LTCNPILRQVKKNIKTYKSWLNFHGSFNHSDLYGLYFTSAQSGHGNRVGPLTDFFHHLASWGSTRGARFRLSTHGYCFPRFPSTMPAAWQFSLSLL
jgi:hypothetical protein